jgi:hypothetical protein
MPNLNKIFLKFPPHRDVQVSWEAGCRKRPLTVGVVTPSQKFEKNFAHLQHLSRSRYGSN